MAQVYEQVSSSETQHLNHNHPQKILKYEFLKKIVIKQVKIENDIEVISHCVKVRNKYNLLII